MGTIQNKTNVASLDRADLYQENEVDRIVNAQNARSAQTFPAATFTTVTGDGREGDKIYVYAFTTSDSFTAGGQTVATSLVNLANINEASILGQAMFSDSYYDPKNRFGAYQPILSGSIKLSFVKKSS